MHSCKDLPASFAGRAGSSWVRSQLFPRSQEALQPLVVSQDPHKAPSSRRKLAKIQISDISDGRLRRTNLIPPTGNYAEPTTSGQLLRLAGKIEVLRRQAAGIVGDQAQAHPVVANVDIRMVAGLLGQLAHPVDEGQRGDESP